VGRRQALPWRVWPHGAPPEPAERLGYIVDDIGRPHNHPQQGEHPNDEHQENVVRRHRQGNAQEVKGKVQHHRGIDAELEE